MPWFGDIFIPYLTDRDTDITKVTIERNFVDLPPQVFDRNAELEAGSYTAILTDLYHERNENLSEQTDAVLSMAARHATEFPYDESGITGHLLVHDPTITITESELIRPAELGLRFMSDDDFIPAIVGTADAISDEFDASPKESIVPIPEAVENVSDYLNGESITPIASIESEEGTIDYYLYDDVRNVISYENPNDDYSSSERIGPVRTFDADSERVYLDLKTLDAGTKMDNGIVRFEQRADVGELSHYDDGWDTIGETSVGVGSEKGHLSNIGNYESTISFVTGGDEYDISMCKGFPVVRCELDGMTDFSFDIEHEPLTLIEDGGYYYAVEDSQGNDIVLVRSSTDGSFNHTDAQVSVDGIDDETLYTFIIGIVPDELTVGDFSRYLYNQGYWKRSLAER